MGQALCFKMVFKPLLDGTDQSRPMIDECGIELDQTGSRLDLGHRGLGTVDAADPDQWKLPLDPLEGFGQNAGGQRKERLARQATRLTHQGFVLQARGPRQGGIGDDHAVNPVLAGDLHQMVEIVQPQIGGDFQQDRATSEVLRPRIAFGDHAAQQIIKGGLVLQIAQTGCIGRGNIDDEVIGHRQKGFDAADIIGGAVSRILVGPDIDPDQTAAVTACFQPLQHRRMALIVETEAVDHRLIAAQPEQARARIALLRQRCDGADFAETTAQPHQGIGHFGILVKARRHPDRIGKIEAESLHPQTSRIGFRGRQRQIFQRGNRGIMRLFGIQSMQRRTHQRENRSQHHNSPAKS